MRSAPAYTTKQQQTAHETRLDVPRHAVAVVPAYNEAANIAKTVRAVRGVARFDEVLVVDGFSSDATARLAEAAGARVVEQRRRMYPGKGIALQTGLEESDADALVFFDADLANVRADMLRRLLDPLMSGRADHSIARYGRAGGRVTELTVRPLLAAFFPEVRFAQPLAGEYGFRRHVLEHIGFVHDWGVESALVIDVVMNGYRSVEVDLGFKDHAMKPLADLREMADQATKTILRKAHEYGRLERFVTAAAVQAA